MDGPIAVIWEQMIEQLLNIIGFFVSKFISLDLLLVLSLINWLLSVVLPPSMSVERVKIEQDKLNRTIEQKTC